ncbi:MAG: hypothetical protein ACI8Z1_003074 [Candidatus Azotimanducaceae bacterium]|jgi:hypothetical protein
MSDIESFTLAKLMAVTPGDGQVRLSVYKTLTVR